MVPGGIGVARRARSPPATTRSRMISGGCSRSVSLSAASSRGIERSAWKETSEPSAYRSSSSATTSFITLGVAQQLDQRPGRRARGGVVPGEHHRDEDAGDVVGGHVDRDQHVEQVAVLAGDLAARDPPVDDPLHQLDQLLARGVADAEATRCRRTGRRTPARRCRARGRGSGARSGESSSSRNGLPIRQAEVV